MRSSMIDCWIELTISIISSYCIDLYMNLVIWSWFIHSEVRSFPSDALIEMDETPTLLIKDINRAKKIWNNMRLTSMVLAWILQFFFHVYLNIFNKLFVWSEDSFVDYSYPGLIATQTSRSLESWATNIFVNSIEHNCEPRRMLPDEYPWLWR